MNFIILLISLSIWIEAYSRPLKALHLTFHKGCQKEIESVAKEIGFDLITWYIPSLPPFFFDGYAKGNALYNIGHERAETIWLRHEDYFRSFDFIITSDTAPLSRIFLQNHWEKPLIIWICNRFDYADFASLDCNFPDDEFYQLFQKATSSDNVHIAAYNAFEHYYAQKKGINTGSMIIKPCCPNLLQTSISLIPSQIIKESTFFLPPYHNEKAFNLSELLNKYNIHSFCGRYNGPYDLLNFKAIIHLPYAWSNLALFENTSLGIPYLIPSRNFMEELASEPKYFHPSLNELLNQKLFHLSEWYCEENNELFTYFDSWDELKYISDNLDYNELRQKIKKTALKNQKEMLDRWQSIFSKIKETF